MDLGLAKELYFREFEGKIQQDSRIGIYVGILTAIAGGLAFLIRSAWLAESILCWFSVGFSVIAAVLWFWVIGFVLSGTIGYIYLKIPSPENLLDYWQKLIGYYQENPGVAGSAREDFEEFLIQRFVSAATENERNNIKRSGRFYFANQILPWVIIVSAVAGLFLAINQFLPFLLQKGR
jgi:hypothetical protein